MAEYRISGIEERLAKAHEESQRLCNGGRWTMRIPADESHDSDLIFGASLADIPRLLDALRESQQELGGGRAEVRREEAALEADLRRALFWLRRLPRPRQAEGDAIPEHRAQAEISDLFDRYPEEEKHGQAD